MGIGYEIWGLQQIDWSNPESIILMIILSAVMIITIWYILCLVLETSKKLIMDKEGCTVSVWGHKKTYKWEELCVKQIVYNTSIFSKKLICHTVYRRCYFFSKTCKKKILGIYHFS